jgi:hypothetical protein
MTASPPDLVKHSLDESYPELRDPRVFLAREEEGAYQVIAAIDAR